MEPDRNATAWLVGVPLAGLAAALVASLTAWFALGLPAARYDPFAMPRFFWYYRGDPDVMRALAGGSGAAAILLAIGAAAVAMQRAPLHGDARFAGEGELRRQGLRARAGIVLGRKRGRYLTFGGPEHVIVEAPTRSGKGVGIVIPNLLSWTGSAVVLDVKRENFAATAGFRARHGQDVFLFNPADREGRTARYNPLGHIDRDDPDDVVIELQKVATMLFVAPDRGEAFWANGARIGFVGAGAYIAEATETPLTFGAIHRLLTQGDVRAFFRRALNDPSLSLSQACRSALADFSSGSDNAFSDIMKTITNILGLWLNPLIDAATAASDFDFRELRRRPMTIYLGVSPDELDRVAPLYTLLLQQLIDLNVRALPGPADRLPVLVVLDEFARLGRASVIAAAFSYVAGYGFRLLPVIQSRSQLRAVYGEHIADEIVANCGVEIAFTPKELRVANELSERIGYVGRASITRSLTMDGLFANRSRSITDHRRALLLPQELMRFPKDKLIVLRGGMAPAIGTKIVSWRDRAFRRRAVPPPVVAPMPERGPSFDPACIERERNAAADTRALTIDDIETADFPSFFADVATLDEGEAVIGTIEEDDGDG